MGVKPKVTQLVRSQACEQVLDLPAVEAAHVEAVLQAAVDKLAIIGLIQVDPRAQALELTQHVGEGVGALIAQQAALEARFQGLVAEQPSLRRLNNKAHLEANQAEVAAVSEELRQATRQLCRSLKDNPNVADNLAKVASERAALQALLVQALAAVASQGRATPLLEAVLAADAAQAEAAATVEAERAASAAVKQLRADLRDEKGQHEERIRASRRTQGSLRDQLRTEGLGNAVADRYHRATLAAGNQAASRLEAAELAELQEALGRVRRQIAMEQAVASTAVGHLEGSAARLGEARDEWDARREEEGRAKERAAEMLTAQRIRELGALRQAEAEYREALAGRLARQAAAREAVEGVARDRDLARRRAWAAAVIQAHWRGYQTREALKGGKKGGKKKGGKKGGGGGKKGGGKKGKKK